MSDNVYSVKQSLNPENDPRKNQRIIQESQKGIARCLDKAEKAFSRAARIALDNGFWAVAYNSFDDGTESLRQLMRILPWGHRKHLAMDAEAIFKEISWPGEVGNSLDLSSLLVESSKALNAISRFRNLWEADCIATSITEGTLYGEEAVRND